MQAFINELSFVEYPSLEELSNALIAMVEMTEVISLLNKEHQLYGEEMKMFRTVENNYIFAESLNRVEKTVRERLKIALKNNVEFWRRERVHRADVEYFCQEIAINVTDTSIAEAAERSIQRTNDTALLNFQNSPFSLSKLHILNKDEGIQTILDAVEDAVNLVLLLERLYPTKRYQYDEKSIDEPKDWQTCLRNTERFKRIGKFSGSKGRIVYKERETGRLFYVDSFHNGKASHVEVFDALKCHLGTADIHNGILDTTQKERGRVLHE
jgi:hypothetical protein